MLTVGTIARFLLGSRSAILAIGATRWSLLIGAILVLSGGLARNYDGIWIPAEWPALSHGIVVSVGNAFILFALVWFAGRGREGGVPFWRGYLAFLGLFWMTAPMAWVYGIPYERWLSPLDALHANMISLGCISVWRVALTTRILSVIFGVPMRRAFWLVMLFADALLLLALAIAPLPVIDFMGGMQQSPQERELASAAFMAGFIGGASLLVWIIGAIWAATGPHATWKVPGSQPATEVRSAPRGALAFAAAALVAWIGIATVSAPEQRLRYETERLLTSGQVAAALKQMSSHTRADYPPMWEPPPRPTWRILEPSPEALRKVLATETFAPWVSELFWEKCRRQLSRPFGSWVPPEEWHDRTTDNYPDTEWVVAAQQHLDHDTGLPADFRHALQSAVDVRMGRPAESGK